MGIDAGPGQLEKMKAAPFAEAFNGDGSSIFMSILIDNKSMDIDAVSGLLEGRNHKVPVIIGSNANEAGVFYAMGSQVFSFSLPDLTSLFSFCLTFLCVF